MNKNTSNKLYWFSFVMALFMVAFHFNVGWTGFIVEVREGERWIVTGLNNYIGLLGNLSLSYFFLSTAFLFYFNLTEENVWKKIKKRVKTLIVPYVVWNIIAFVWYSFLNRSLFTCTGVADFLYQWLISPYDAPLWYIVVIFALTFLAPALLKLKKHPKVLLGILAGIYIFAFVYCACGVYKQVPVLTDYLERLVRYMPLYFTGAAIALLQPELITENKADKYSKVCLILYVIGALYVCFGTNAMVKWIFVELQVMIVWPIFKAELFSKEVKDRYKNSFIIYASHALWCRGFVSFCWHFISEWNLVISGLAGIAVHVLYVVITHFAVLIFVWIVKKNRLLYTALSGGR